VANPELEPVLEEPVLEVKLEPEVYLEPELEPVVEVELEPELYLDPELAAALPRNEEPELEP